jgi:hypothetical protein
MTNRENAIRSTMPGLEGDVARRMTASVLQYLRLLAAAR